MIYRLQFLVFIAFFRKCLNFYGNGVCKSGKETKGKNEIQKVKPQYPPTGKEGLRNLSHFNTQHCTELGVSAVKTEISFYGYRAKRF